MFDALRILITPRGYGELRSRAEMLKLLNRKIVEQVTMHNLRGRVYDYNGKN